MRRAVAFKFLLRSLEGLGVPMLVALLVAVSAGLAAAAQGDAFVDGVRDFTPGEFAGFGQGGMPGVVLGAPEGLGAIEGSTDVVSLGVGGEITLVFRDNVLFDGPGDDLVVFENAFHSGDESGPIFAELAFVEVSADRVTWTRFPFDEETGEGLAGRTAVHANRDNGIDPLTPEAGGDRFDLADLGLTFVRFVRIIDVAGQISDPGDLVAPADKGGCDIDAVAAINSTVPASVVGTVAAAGQPVAHARVKLWPAAGGRKLRRRTAADGSFRFGRIVPLGDYVVRARRLGMGKDTANVFVDMVDHAAEIELRLQRRP